MGNLYTYIIEMGFFDGYSVDTEIAIYDPSGNRLTSNDDIDPWSTNPRSAVYLIKCRASTYPYVYVAVGHWDAPLTGGTTGQTISNMDWSAAAPLYAEEGPAPYRNRSPGGAQASQGMRCLDEVPALPGQRGDVEARSCEQPLGPPARGSPSAAACGRDSRRHRRGRRGATDFPHPRRRAARSCHRTPRCNSGKEKIYFMPFNQQHVDRDLYLIIIYQCLIKRS